MIDTVIENVADIAHTIEELNKEAIRMWKQDIFLTWRWWLALSLLVIPWLVWWKVKPETGWGRYLLAGLILYVIASILDSVGVAFAMWTYPIAVVPYLHSFYVPWDLTLIPVSAMLLLQFTSKISVYKIALIYALTAAYIAEPIFVWLKIYEPLSWKHTYGVPIYFVLYLLAYKISRIKQLF